MRSTWDALAATGAPVYVGDPERGAEELAGLFGRLGADPRGGVCVEVGCGPGRMTSALAARFDVVVAVDVSPAMVERARSTVTASNVRFTTVSGNRLDGVETESANVLVCYLVLQHLPGAHVVRGYLEEFARVLRPGGEAFVQLPVLAAGVRPRLWRLARSALVPMVARLSQRPERRPAFRGFRLTEGELETAIQSSGLRERARAYGPDSPYRHSRDLFLRLQTG